MSTVASTVVLVRNPVEAGAYMVRQGFPRHCLGLIDDQYVAGTYFLVNRSLESAISIPNDKETVW